MAKRQIDTIDIQILSDLQKDGRMSNVQLAENAQISAPPCLRRVRALEDAGYIKSYHAKLSPEKLGFGIAGFAFVSLQTQADDDLSSFEKFIQTIPQVREMHMLTGAYDFILKIVGKDWEEFNKLITDITAYESVSSVKSALTLRCGKNEPIVPIELLDE